MKSGTGPTDKYAKRVCKIGQGALCCRYLTMTEGGWNCAKHTSMALRIDDTCAAGKFTARADNCEGYPAR